MLKLDDPVIVGIRNSDLFNVFAADPRTSEYDRARLAEIQKKIDAEETPSRSDWLAFSAVLKSYARQFVSSVRDQVVSVKISTFVREGLEEKAKDIGLSMNKIMSTLAEWFVGLTPVDAFRFYVTAIGDGSDSPEEMGGLIKRLEEMEEAEKVK